MFIIIRIHKQRDGCTHKFKSGRSTQNKWGGGGEGLYNICEPVMVGQKEYVMEWISYNDVNLGKYYGRIGGFKWVFWFNQLKIRMKGTEKIMEEDINKEI